MNRHRDDDPARDVLDTAARLAGIESADATLIRDGSNTLYQLAERLVARISPPGTGERATREVAISRWLSTQGISVVQTAPDIRQDIVIDDRPVTWWVTLPSHRAATPAELARVLCAFHALAPPADLVLPNYDPFAGFGDSINTSLILGGSERQWLTRRVHQLRAQYQEPTSPKLLHGDAWQDNVAVTESGEAILLDLEHVSLGRQHWDLVLIAADYTDFARITVDEYRSFVDEYGGFDITRYGDYRTLADIAELRWTCFALRKAATNPRAVREIRHRIACLQGQYPKPWTWNAL